MWDCSQVKNRRCGFTLIELLVVISIIALLLSVLVPALGKVKEKARRLLDTSNTRQFAMVCIAYSNDNKAWLPKGNVQGTSADTKVFPSSWSAFNGDTWTMLKQSYGLSEENAMCAAWAREYSEEREWFFEMTKVGGPALANTRHESRIGFMYFGRQWDQDGASWNPDYAPKKLNGTLYKSPKKTSDTLNDMGSRTLVTCYYWDNKAPGGTWGAKVPHVNGDRMKIFSPEEPLEGVDGLAIGYIDGSSEWAPWGKLDSFVIAGSRYYYSN